MSNFLEVINQTVVNPDEENYAIQCADCENCISGEWTLYCACVKDYVGIRERVYAPCEIARVLINGDGNLDCEFFKRRTSFFQSAILNIL